MMGLECSIDIITAEILENHARANYHAVRNRSPLREQLPYWEGQSPLLQSHYRDSARWALNAVVNDIVRAVLRVQLGPDAGKEPVK